MENEKLYDMIIIGAGVSGLAGAMYAGRMGMDVLVIGELRGGLITTTDIVENYPGFISISGIDLAKRLEEHALFYKTVQIKDERAEKISKEGNIFKVKTDAAEYKSKTILYATGTEVRKLEAKGEETYRNKGVHYCALCDGAFYKDKVVAVIGGSDSAAKEALLLTQWAKKVFIIYRGNKIRAEPINYEKVMSNEKIEIIYNTNVIELLGDKKLKAVKLDNPYKNSEILELDGIFVAIGHVPLSKLAAEIGVQTDEKGYVKINRNSETNIPGVFAAGDVTDTRFKQAIVGVGEAVEAVYSAYLYLQNFKG
jgi:thioredoxin reductase (NADPH)